MRDRNGNWHCDWCGDSMPEDRGKHHNCCSAACYRALGLCSACHQPNPTPRFSTCDLCRAGHRERWRAARHHIPDRPSTVARCRCGREREDLRFSNCEPCRSKSRVPLETRRLIA